MSGCTCLAPLLALLSCLASLVTCQSVDWSPPDSSYLLVWQEEFSYPDNTQPSSSIWNWETGGNGWGNNELEYYTARPINSNVSSDTLIVTGLWESYNGRSITSARMDTSGKVEVYLGVVAARVRAPGMQNGYWPAVWMLGNKTNSLGWPFCGEIDFMEQVNGYSAPGTPSDDHYQHGSLHYNVGGESTYPNSNAAQQTSVISTNNASMLWGDDWHVYAVEWTTSTISFILDSTVYSSFSLAASDYDAFRDPTNPFFLLIDFAFGGSFPQYTPVQSEFPAQLEIDWLRVYQQPGGSSYLATPAGTFAARSSSSTAAYTPSPSSTSTTSFSSGESSTLPSYDSSSTAGTNTHASGAYRRAEFGVSCLLLITAMFLLSSAALLWS